MDEQSFGEKPTFSFRNIGIAVFILALVILIVISSQKQTPAKPSLDDKLVTLKSYRDLKKSHENTIAQEKQAIYTLDQKIVPLKCGIYSEVGAKEQWNIECQDLFVEQQSKINGSTGETISYE